MKSIVFSLMASALLACAGCSSGDLGIPGDGTDGNGNNGGNGGGGDGTGTNSTPPLCTTTGTAYAGFAGTVLGSDRVQAVIVGADRIAANGDSANKIGTYSLSVLAKAHDIPFYIAAPSSTFDLSIESGEQIPIEQRASTEITNAFGRQTAPDGCDTYNPAFDVAPAANITALITEKGVIQPVTKQRIAEVLKA